MENEEKKANEAMFINLVSSLYTSAMHSLGKIMNPVSGKIERNLEAARANIEILRMLREKTGGNLSEEETRVLNDALSNMQMNYVEEMDREKKAGAGEEPEKPSGDGKKEEQ